MKKGNNLWNVFYVLTYKKYWNQLKTMFGDWKKNNFLWTQIELSVYLFIWQGINYGTCLVLRLISKNIERYRVLEKVNPN